MSIHWWFGEEKIQGQDVASQMAMYYREDARRPWAKYPMATQVDRILSQVCFCQ